MLEVPVLVRLQREVTDSWLDANIRLVSVYGDPIPKDVLLKMVEHQCRTFWPKWELITYQLSQPVPEEYG